MEKDQELNEDRYRQFEGGCDATAEYMGDLTVEVAADRSTQRQMTEAEMRGGNGST